jgi:hypothetical protein
MTTAGDNITKANITASMAELITLYNKDIVWKTGNNPFQNTALIGDDISITNIDTTLASDNVIADPIAQNFKIYSSLLSRIRLVRLQKWYQNQGDPRSSLQYDETQMTNLNMDYVLTDAEVTGLNGNPNSEDTISASNLDLFVATLSAIINDKRTNTVTIEEFYCHSNCHGSCHGSL